GVRGKGKRGWSWVRGGKGEAQIECARLIAAVDNGTAVEPSKVTVADFVRARLTQWEAAGEISPRTAQRYRHLIKNQIVPHLGAKILRNLKALDIEQWHTTLRLIFAP